jgi:hypothetical protein
MQKDSGDGRLSDIFHPENEGNMFLPNTGSKLPHYMASHLTIQQSSKIT